MFAASAAVSILLISAAISTRQSMKIRSATSFQKANCSVCSVIQRTYCKRNWKFKQKFCFLIIKELLFLRC